MYVPIRLFQTKLLCLAFFLLASQQGISQREKVHVDLDKYTCLAGDTVYLKGVILQGGHLSTLSTNLYIDLYSPARALLSRETFPIRYGQSIGQVIIPDSLETGNYFLVGFTRQQLNYPHEDLPSIPILIYNRDKKSSVFHQRPVFNPQGATTGMINGFTWITTPYKGKLSGNKNVLSSLLKIDSSLFVKKVKIIMPLHGDSTFEDTAVLTKSDNQKYFLLPMDYSQPGQTILLYADSTLIGQQYLKYHNDSVDISLQTDTLDISPFAYNSWNLQLPGKKKWYTSITVSDADRSISSPAPITRLKDSHTDDLTIPDTPSDTSFISFIGKATRQSGKKIKDDFVRQLVVAGYRDTNYLFVKTINLDSANIFQLDSLRFFGSIGLKFQVNGMEDASGKDVKLRLASYVPQIDPSIIIGSDWVDDSTISLSDTNTTKAEQMNYDLSKLKMLQTVIVRARKDPRDELDETYPTGPFSEGALYSYDLRKDSTDRDLFMYINNQGIRLSYDPLSDMLKDDLKHPIHYFLDDQERSALFMRSLDFDRLAYMKIIESDFLSTQETQFTLSKAGKGPLGIPDQKTAINVCVYTRKDKDFRTMRGGMNNMLIRGYTEILPFSSDKTTLFWHPLESGQSFRIRFNNSEATHKFRIKVEGVRPSGEVFYYETVIAK